MRKILISLAAMAAPFSYAAATEVAPPYLLENDQVHSYILLDRTGSMSSIWDEALSSVNSYANSVAKPEVAGAADDLETAITFAVFDSQQGLQFDVLRKGVDADAWTNVTNDEASPRGMTPLFDAIGQMIALAEKDAPGKAVIVVMTDGMENASREITRDGAKAALDRARARGWEVVFLGAEFAKFDDADAVGVSGAKSMAVGAGQMNQTMEALAQKSRAYATGEEIEFDAEDRVQSGEADVIRRKGQ